MEFPFDPASFRHASHRLVPMQPAWAAALGEQLAAMDPWQTLDYSPAALTRYLAAENPQRQALALLVDDAPAACLTIRPHWLRGPLLELLAVLPPFQGRGQGQELVQWLAEEARRQGQGNLWTLTSAFNHAARRFYQRQGFVEIGELPGLVTPNEAEILLRLPLESAEP